MSRQLAHGRWKAALALMAGCVVCATPLHLAQAQGGEDEPQGMEARPVADIADTPDTVMSDSPENEQDPEQAKDVSPEPSEPVPVEPEVTPPVLEPTPVIAPPGNPLVAPAPEITPAANVPAADTPASPPVVEAPVTGVPEPHDPGAISSEFTFGSYGRVRGATDFEGGRPAPMNVVSHGSRVDEYNYAELEFQQLFTRQHTARHKVYAQVVGTLAMGDDLFHFTGDFDQSMAMRNLYAELGWKVDGLTLAFWGGSRMYRGDDIYLLDFWPLDNLNTVGGGGWAAYDWSGKGRTEFKLHSGSALLNDPFQLQVVQVPGFDFGTQDVTYLNRQRIISSARLQHDLWLGTRPDGSPTSGMKLVLYGEDHRLPEGRRRLDDGLSEEVVPAESGRKLGAELGVWRGEGFFKGSFANLFYAQATDLAAYGEFGVPTGVNLNETSEGAAMRMVALSADLETPYAGLLVGSYYKYFRDADRDSEDFDDYWESIIAARAHVYLTDHIHPGLEYSYQLRRPAGPFAPTDQFEVPTVSKFSVIQAFRLKKGMYSRPEVRFMYTRSQLNASAVRLFPMGDPRTDRASSNGQLTTHYMGVMVEWWFNNASLFRP